MPTNVGNLYGFKDLTLSPQVIYTNTETLVSGINVYNNEGAILGTAANVSGDTITFQPNIAATYINGFTDSGTTSFIYEDANGNFYTLNSGIYTMLPSASVEKGQFDRYMIYEKRGSTGMASSYLSSFWYFWDNAATSPYNGFPYHFSYRGVTNPHFYVRNFTTTSYLRNSSTITIIQQVTPSTDLTPYEGTDVALFTGSNQTGSSSYERLYMYTIPNTCLRYNNQIYKYYYTGTPSSYTYKAYTYSNSSENFLFFMTQDAGQLKYTTQYHNVADVYDSTGGTTSYYIKYISDDLQTIALGGEGYSTGGMRIQSNMPGRDITLTRDPTQDSNSFLPAS